MSTKSGKKGSQGLGVLLEWIFSLPLSPTKQQVMIVYAKHSNYWDGTNSRPSLSTVAKKARLKSIRRVQQLLRELQADPACETCGGIGTQADEFGQTSRCPCFTRQCGHLIQTSPAMGQQPAVFRLNVRLEFSTVSTAPADEASGWVKSSTARGEIFVPPGVKFSPPQGRNFRSRNKEDRSLPLRADRSNTNTPHGAMPPEENERKNFTPEALTAWLEIKQAMRARLTADDWKLWVRPARLLRQMSSKQLLIAVPVNARIMEAAASNRQLLNQVAQPHGFRVHLARYPDHWEVEEARRRFGIDYRKRPQPATRARSMAARGGA